MKKPYHKLFMSFDVMLAMAGAAGLLIFLQLLLYEVVQSESVVFNNKCASVINYDKQTVGVKCDQTAKIYNINKPLTAQYLFLTLQQKTPVLYCKLINKEYTGNDNINCEIKVKGSKI